MCGVGTIFEAPYWNTASIQGKQEYETTYSRAVRKSSGVDATDTTECVGNPHILLWTQRTMHLMRKKLRSIKGTSSVSFPKGSAASH